MAPNLRDGRDHEEAESSRIGHRDAEVAVQLLLLGEKLTPLLKIRDVVVHRFGGGREVA